MAQRKKRIGDLRRTLKDFPVIRTVIMNEGWVPLVLCDEEGAYWNGLTAIDQKGQIQNALSDSQRKQLVNMLKDGYFGTEVLDAVIDDGRYWKIRDDLFNWPNPVVIAEKKLRVMELRRPALDGS
jgi:hypothetical protein